MGKVVNPTVHHELTTKCLGELAELAFSFKAYKLGEIDFLAAYIVPADIWYIVPLKAFLGLTSLLFRRRDDPRPGRYDDYYEAWHLLRPKMQHCDRCGAHTPLPRT
jgi:hypothetical protein